MAGIGDNSPSLSEKDIALGRSLEVCPKCGGAYVVAAGKTMRCFVCAPLEAIGLSLDCPHRGLVVRSERIQACCGSTRKVKVFACGLHLAADGMSGECSIEKVDGVRNCEACIRSHENNPKSLPQDAPGVEREAHAGG